MQQTNQNFTVAASQTVGASGNTGDLDNASFTGLVLFANISAISGTSPTIVFTIEGKDPVSGAYYTLLASASLNATGLTTLTVYPASPAVNNSVANAVLPRTFRVKWTVGGTGPSVTFSLGASFVPV